eukprot:TRINITY_DN1762_c0_g1_i4.p1 TRINITY_DN1762_c0_g1~~TRINITY_DN1762_c0_g1_i4.p1  ORF type:complete len:748 (+),score=187.01 TRINITY_DN1762_c0_g1_i4:84-2327(+)
MTFRVPTPPGELRRSATSPTPITPTSPPTALPPITQNVRFGGLRWSRTRKTAEPDFDTAPSRIHSPGASSAKTSVTSHQHEEAAALCAAAAEGDVDQLQALLESGISPDRGDYDRRTALHLASEEGHLACVAELVTHGANVNCRDRWGTTPLRGAVHNLHNEVANYLRDHGAKISEEQADKTAHARRRLQCRQWFEKVLTFAGLSPEAKAVPLCALAAYLLVHHGIDVHAHPVIAAELHPLKRRLREMTSDADADEVHDLRKWLSSGAKFPRNLSLPEPPAVKEKPQKAPAALPKITVDRGPSPALSASRFSRFSREGSCSGSRAESTVSALDSHPSLRAEWGLSDAKAEEMFALYGRSIIFFNDLAVAAVGDQESPTAAAQQQTKNKWHWAVQKMKKKKPEHRRGPTALTLQRVMLETLQINNWRAFVGAVASLAADALNSPNDGSCPQDLGDQNPHLFSVSVCTVDGQQFAMGDTEDFTMQSCMRPFLYAAAVEEYGAEHVHEFVGQEPNGRSSDDFELTSTGKPFNAVTSAGGIIVASLYHPEETVQDRSVRFQGVIRRLSGQSKVGVDEALFKQAESSSYRNHAIASYLMCERCFAAGCDTMPEYIRHVNFFLRSSSVRTNCQGVANIAATLANYGNCGLTGEKCLGFATVKLALQLAFTSGMCNSSGQWACTVGIPAKSGETGAIWLSVPGVLGLCVRSPRLDADGNSVRAQRFSRQFAHRFQWGVMDLLYRARDSGEGDAA